MNLAYIIIISIQLFVGIIQYRRIRVLETALTPLKVKPNYSKEDISSLSPVRMSVCYYTTFNNVNIGDLVAISKEYIGFHVIAATPTKDENTMWAIASHFGLKDNVN